MTGRWTWWELLALTVISMLIGFAIGLSHTLSCGVPVA